MKILNFVPQKDNAISFYRGHGVMSELRKLNNAIDCVFPENFDLKQAKGVDMAYFVRPDTPELLAILMACKQLNIKTVVDIDDNLFNVPWHNKYHIQYLIQKIDYKSNIRLALQAADAVTVTTDSLKMAFGKYNKNIHVIRNAFDNYTYKIKETRNISNRVLWRGSSFHHKDLSAFKDSLLSIIKTNPDFVFMFMGDIFPNWLQNIKNVQYIKPCSIYEYPHKLEKLEPALTIVPLQYNGEKSLQFNLGKSDIAKMEATAAGSLCIAPEWSEWVWNKDDFYYNNTDSFVSVTNEAINKIRNCDETLDAIFERNKQHIKTYRLLSQTNLTRLALFRNTIASK